LIEILTIFTKSMKKILLLILLIITVSSNLNAQSGIKFAELAKRIDVYFDRALINDLHQQLPQGTDYTIWGWDVGDFSGDGYNELALSLRLAADRKRQMHVYLFVDIEGYLTKVAQYQFDFVDLPLEIGIVIDNGTCYVTQKQQQFNWTIRGYEYKNGIIMKKDIFTTQRIGDMTMENYQNFVDLKNSKKFLFTRSGQQRYANDYMTIPSYQRGRLIYQGYAGEVLTDYINYVHSGAYYWSGAEDLSYSISSAYDEEFLYFTVNVTDDKVVIQNCDTCIADFVEVWIDANEYPQSRYAYIENNRLITQNRADSNLFCFSVYPGNFVEEPAYVKIRTNSELSLGQKMESRSIAAVSNLTEKGYVLRFKIPLTFLNLQDRFDSLNDFFEVGCTFVAHDYDNEFRPEEKSELATSVFDSTVPHSYGTLVFVPYKQWYGDSYNFYKEEIFKILSDYGF